MGTRNNPYTSKIHVYKRFIDDRFILWEGSFGEHEIQFLDLNITHRDEKYITSTYFKAVHINS